MSTAVAPTERGKVSALPSPYAKNSLAAEKTTSSSRIPSTCFAYSSAVQYRFACVWTAPLGLPVEPDEYNQNEIPSALLTNGVRCGSASANRRLNTRSPGRLGRLSSWAWETISAQPSLEVSASACAMVGSSGPDAMTARARL